MNRKTCAAFVLAVGLSAGAGFYGARALGAAEKTGHVEADAVELDRTKGYLQGHVSTAVSTLKQIANDATAESFEAKKAEREKAIEAAVKPFQEDAEILALQGHLLCLDRVADAQGEAAAQFIQAAVYTKVGADAAEVAKRLETTKLGHGGLILGYLVARVSKTPADEVFKGKEGHTWAEVMRLRGVTAQQIVKEFASFQ